MQDYLDKVYQGNITGFEQTAQLADAEQQLQMLLGNDTAGSRVYLRLYRYLTSIVQHSPDAQWLTVGDGRYGLDGYHLGRMGARRVMITDIAPALLDIAVERQLIPGYRLMNAEAMDMADNSVDYVLCKEALHHFPRPYLGLYEMLRVAQQAVVLVEPHDVLGAWPLLRWLENGFDKIRHWTGLRLSPYRTRYSYETVGNFVYKINARDMERLAGGLGLPLVMVRGHNYFWQNGLHRVPHSRRWASGAYRKVALKKGVADLGRWLGLLPPGLITVVIFKEMPDAALQKAMRRQGYVAYPIPPNPYLKKD